MFDLHMSCLQSQSATVGSLEVLNDVCEAGLCLVRIAVDYALCGEGDIRLAT